MRGGDRLQARPDTVFRSLAVLSDLANELLGQDLGFQKSEMPPASSSRAVSMWLIAREEDRQMKFGEGGSERV